MSIGKKRKAEEAKLLVNGIENEYELEFVEKHPEYDFIIGVDEAGRGCLAGPVFAVACTALPKHCCLQGVDDSKRVKPKDRLRIYNKLIQDPTFKWFSAKVSSEMIDQINIRQATLKAMRLAIVGLLKKLNPKNPIAFIDGREVPTIPNTKIKLKAEIKGDQRIYCVAAASIIAKVLQVDYMENFAQKEYPRYQFNKHKGYGTELHRTLISRYGGSEIHRFSFAPLKYAKDEEEEEQKELTVLSNSSTSSQY